MNKQQKKIFIAGHKGMVGSAIREALAKDKRNSIITAPRDELDLMNQIATLEFFASHDFDEVYLAAAKVGGIRANSSMPADFIYENLIVQNNVIHSAWKTGVGKSLFLGSSCIYPKYASQPIAENSLLSGDLEPTNSAYAVAKIAGLELCKNFNQQYGTDFRSVMPTNLYGPNDNFHLDDAHVLPALLRRFHEAKCASADQVVIWGSGKPYREFMHVNDMARGCVHVMGLEKEEYYSKVSPEYQYFNIGTGSDISIKDLAYLIADIVGFNGNIEFDTTQPDGTPRKLLDVNLIEKTGWKALISLQDGISSTYKWYLDNISNLRL